MSRFQFRAWNTINKEMIYNSNQSCFDPSMNVGWVIEQATGLKDKHGKMVFEGDVCRVEFHDGSTEILAVGWHDEHACFYFYQLDGDGFWRITQTPIEIIGEIHEPAHHDNHPCASDNSGKSHCVALQQS